MHAAMQLRRVIALGASNLTRGFQTVVVTSRDEWGRDVEILAALGHGRSYGSESRVLARTLPGILQSGLWRQLEDLPPVATRVLLTDVGNDILYGYSPAQILVWVREAVDRLERYSHDIVITGLPRVGAKDISSAKFFLFRSVLFPRCRLTFEEVAESARVVNDGLAALARERGARFVPLRSEWYGVDPIHIRPSRWQRAWREILCGEPIPDRDRMSFVEGWRLYAMRPEHQRVFGVEFGRPQRGVVLRAGARVWLF
jgi:hypothetical protein